MIYYITGETYDDPNLAIGHSLILPVNDTLSTDFDNLARIMLNITVKQELFSIKTLDHLNKLGKVTVIKTQLH